MIAPFFNIVFNPEDITSFQSVPGNEDSMRIASSEIVNYSSSLLRKYSTSSRKAEDRELSSISEGLPRLRVFPFFL